MQRTILVTGCSSGIGRHCALRLKETGWRVFATARRPRDILDLAELGLESLFLDYANTDSIHAAFDEVMGRTEGRLDALFNNGAYAQPGAVEDLPLEALRLQFEANVFGWHSLTRLALQAMRRQGHGRLVHCSSILGLVPYRWRGAYVASKYAIEGLMSSLRMELRGSDIHVSLIEPGPIVSRIGPNAIEHFKRHIDFESSVHRDFYRKYLEKLERGGGRNRFRLGPEAVFVKLAHALDSARPREHYPVTFPTRFIVTVKRFLPQRLIDRLIASWD